MGPLVADASSRMELIDLIPNSMSFRIVSTLDLADGDDPPAGFTGRVRGRVDGRGPIVTVAWYHDGVLHNPGRTHPAFRRFRPDGTVKFEMFYATGRLQDPAPDHPAVRGYYADGTVHYEERWTMGRRHDGSDGSAAVRKWRADGSLRHELRYRHGTRLAVPA